MRTVVWTDQAQTTLADITTFISGDSLTAARKVMSRITEAAAQLGSIPTGRRARIRGVYEKSLPDIRYIIAYALDDPPGTVTILRIIHTARDWPSDTWPD